MTEELLTATVSVRGVVFSNDDVLILQRSTDHEWELPGGRLGPDEPVVSGLRRELREETLLEVDVVDIVHATAWRNDENDGRFAVYYLCRTDRRPVRLSEEHADSKWVSSAEATTTLAKSNATAVRRANRRRIDQAREPSVSG
ncbi:NUDIX hydrolase [Halopiger thermotolerans]